MYAEWHTARLAYTQILSRSPTIGTENAQLAHAAH